MFANFGFESVDFRRPQVGNVHVRTLVDKGDGIGYDAHLSNWQLLSEVVARK